MFDFLRKILSEGNLKIKDGEAKFRSYEEIVNECHRNLGLIAAKIDEINCEFNNRHRVYLFVNCARAINGCNGEPKDPAHIKNNLTYLASLLNDELNRDYLSNQIGVSRRCGMSNRRMLQKFLINQAYSIGRIYDNIDDVYFLRNGITAHPTKVGLISKANKILEKHLYKSKTTKTIDEMVELDFLLLWKKCLELANNALIDLHRIY